MPGPFSCHLTIFENPLTVYRLKLLATDNGRKKTCVRMDTGSLLLQLTGVARRPDTQLTQKFILRST